MTWIPNEISDYDMTIVTFLDRTMNAKGKILDFFQDFRFSNDIKFSHYAYFLPHSEVTKQVIFDFFFFPAAWLARLWEITVTSGIVVIVSKDDIWSKDSLSQYFRNE